MQMELPLTDEAAKRDASIDQVLANAGPDWRQQAIAIVRGLAVAEVTGEDIRLACEAQNIRPHHHNAWGGLTSTLIKHGVLVPTGRYTAMKAEGSHARKTQIYHLNITDSALSEAVRS